MTRSPKQKLLGAIRRDQAAAALLRLDGKIAGAMRYEEELQRRCNQAEANGWADEALDACDDGLRDARNKRNAMK